MGVRLSGAKQPRSISGVGLPGNDVFKESENFWGRRTRAAAWAAIPSVASQSMRNQYNLTWLPITSCLWKKVTPTYCVKNSKIGHARRIYDL
jgi:hypothetical protein